MSMMETMKAMNQVAKDLIPLKRMLKSAVILVALGIILNVLALVLFYLHITNVPVTVMVRIILGIAGLVLVRKVQKIVRFLEEKYRAP